MAMRSFPFDSEFLRENEMGFPEGDRDANSAEWSLYIASFISNGILPKPSDGMKVLPGGKLTVTVQPGRVFINGRLGYTDEPVLLALAPADSDLDRIDRIVARLDLSADKRHIEIFAVTGTPATEPQPPDVIRNDKVHELVLADVLVVKGITEILLHHITDTRLDGELCGVAVQLVDEVDFSQFYNQFGKFEEKYNNWFTDYTTQADIDFMTWFNSLKDILNESAAGNILNLIENKIITSPTQPINQAAGGVWLDTGCGESGIPPGGTDGVVIKNMVISATPPQSDVLWGDTGDAAQETKYTW